MKIGITSLYTPNIASYASLTAAQNRLYADKYGYDIKIHTDTLCAERPPSWSKIKAVLQLFDECDWAMWIDADAVITDFSIPLDTFIDNEYDLIIGSDCNGINAGVFFIRDCLAASEFLGRTWEQTQFITHQWWEQAAMTYLLQNFSSIIKHKIVSDATFNKTPDRWNNDFILHTAGVPQSKRFDILRRKLTNG